MKIIRPSNKNVEKEVFLRAGRLDERTKTRALEPNELYFLVNAAASPDSGHPSRIEVLGGEHPYRHHASEAVQARQRMQ
jgi:hypothetical protein